MKNLLKIALTLSLAIAAACNDSSVSPRSAKADGTAVVEAPPATDPKLIELLGKINEKLDNIQPAAPIDSAALAKEIGDRISGPDTDDDGIKDAVDKCVNEKEDVDEFEDEDGCADKDNDKDNILDDDDDCKGLAGLLSDEENQNGCPDPDLDLDEDGVKNRDDYCPDEKGPPNEDDEKNGCPDPEADTDGDGVKDREDKCLAEKGSSSDDPEKNGCAPEIEMVAPEPKAADCDDDKTKAVKVKVPPPPMNPEQLTKAVYGLRGRMGKLEVRVELLELDASNWRSDHDKLDSVAKELAARRPGVAPAPQADKPPAPPQTTAATGTFDLGVK